MSDLPKNILIAGSRGSIGSAFCDYCKELSIPFEVLLPFPCSLSSLRKALKDQEITHFFNCSGYSNDKTSVQDTYLTFDSNVHCVFNQLEAIKEWSPNTSYINFGSVYEETRDTPYASSKRMSRDLIESYRINNGLNAVQATLSYTEYYKKDANRLLQNIIRKLIQLKFEEKIRNNQSILMLKNEDDVFHFTWATDVCAGAFSLLDKEAGASHQLINKGGYFFSRVVDLILHELELPESMVKYTNDRFNGKNEVFDLYGNFNTKVNVPQIIKNLVSFELKQII